MWMIIVLFLTSRDQLKHERDPTAWSKKPMTWQRKGVNNADKTNGQPLPAEIRQVPGYKELMS